MKKKVKLGIAAGVLAAAAIVTVARSGKAAPETYRFVTVQRGDVDATVSATGTLEPVRTVQVGTQVSGQISALYADYNSHVKKGELIARLDPTLLKQAVIQAGADAERAKADLDQAKYQLDQSKRLFATKVITETDYRTAEHAWAVADAANTSAQASLDRARQNLRYANIYSPIDGVVIERNVDVGQTVAASFSAPQLFLLARDLTQMQILAQVDESDIGQIKVGQPVTFTVQAYPDQTFDGTVSQVRLESKTEENVVDYTVVISVANKDGKLLPGMTATATFLVASATNVLKVPDAAVRFHPSQEMMAELRSERSGQDSTRGAMAARGQGAGGGGPGAARPGAGSRGPSGGGASAAGQGAPSFAAAPGSAWGGGRPTDRATLWYLDGTGKLQTIRVKLGLSDGQMTEISGNGLKEGMNVVAGVTSSSAEEATQGSTNPFQGGNRGGGRFRMGF
ncbi:MAG: efflux RND transporter periplasmic adaptor subunit [Gemmatimonadetes bacterium]|nr:efflux RND transporter periplasmic adaptor subunit [Gemmatimonadota bacterium]